jgi:hypothetical protein
MNNKIVHEHFVLFYEGGNFAMNRIPTMLVMVTIFTFFNCKDLNCWTKHSSIV